MITALIIDDEVHCQKRLSTLLIEHFSSVVHLIDIADDIDSGLMKIKTLNPQLVFLDVHLHDKTSFDLLRLLPEINFKIIFTTSFEKYALEAFRFSAIDYILKPIELSELRKALDKVTTKTPTTDVLDQLKNLVYNFNQSSFGNKKICIATAEEIHFINTEDIIRCESDVNYTKIFLNNQKKITASKTLKDFDDMLSNHNFFRVHQSHLINLAHIKSYKKGKGGIVVMLDGAEVEVSTRKKEEFLKRVFDGK